MKIQSESRKSHLEEERSDLEPKVGESNRGFPIRSGIARGICLILIVAIAGGASYLYFSKKRVIAGIEQERAQNRQNLEERRASDAKASLTAAKQAIESSDWRLFEQQIKRAKALDAGGELAQDIATLQQLRARAETLQQRNKFISETLQKAQEYAQNHEYQAAESLYTKALLQYPESAELKEAKVILLEEHKAYLKKEKEKIISEHLQTLELHMENVKWRQARQLVSTLRELGASEKVKKDTLARIKHLEELEKEQQQEAIDLLELIRRQDNGKYSPEAIKQLDNQIEMLPRMKALQDYREEIYQRTWVLKIPEDVETLAGALKLCREGDQLSLAAGTYSGTIRVEKGISIRGRSREEVIVMNQADTGPALSFHKGQSVLENLTIRGSGIHTSEHGYAGVSLVGGKLTIKNVTVSGASGHGVAVQSGDLVIEDSEINDSSWNGLAVYGEKSKASLKNTHILLSCQYGIEVWRGAELAMSGQSRVESSAGAGLVLQGMGSRAQVERSGFHKNRQSGIALSGGAEARISHCQMKENLYSGLTAEGEGTQVSLGGLEVSENQQAGIWLEKSVILGEYRDCQVENNELLQIYIPQRDIQRRKRDR